MWCFPGELCGHTTFDLRFFVVKTWWNVWLAWWKHGVSLADISGRKVCQKNGIIIEFLIYRASVRLPSGAALA